MKYIKIHHFFIVTVHGTGKLIYLQGCALFTEINLHNNSKKTELRKKTNGRKS